MPEESGIRLVVGLGNPGKAYEQTRHNAGFLVVERLSARWERTWQNWDGIAELSRPDAGNRATLFKPLQYMNRSGIAVRDIIRYLGIPPQELLVVYDDFALPLGKLRLRRSGSAGGHNGLCSVIEQLGTADVPRLRLGVGPVPPHINPADFVLSKFSPGERDALETMLEQACGAVEMILAEGWDRAASSMPAERKPQENA